jgi:hypothetical protein
MNRGQRGVRRERMATGLAMFSPGAIGFVTKGAGEVLHGVGDF